MVMAMLEDVVADVDVVVVVVVVVVVIVVVAWQKDRSK